MGVPHLVLIRSHVWVVVVAISGILCVGICVGVVCFCVHLLTVEYLLTPRAKSSKSMDHPDLGITLACDCIIIHHLSLNLGKIS
jgi:hypothetical protein